MFHFNNQSHSMVILIFIIFLRKKKKEGNKLKKKKNPSSWNREVNFTRSNETKSLRANRCRVLGAVETVLEKHGLLRVGESKQWTREPVERFVRVQTNPGQALIIRKGISQRFVSRSSLSSLLLTSNSFSLPLVLSFQRQQ